MACFMCEQWGKSVWDSWNLFNRKCYISCTCQVAVHATCLFIGQLKETVQEMVPYPIAGHHVQETCDFLKKEVFKTCCRIS